MSSYIQLNVLEKGDGVDCNAVVYSCSGRN